MTTLFDMLGNTGSTLVWANTTPVSGGHQGTIVADVVCYNHVAERIVAAGDIVVDDQYKLALARLNHFESPRDVHCINYGEKVLSQQSAYPIRDSLRRPAAAQITLRL